MQQMLNNSKYTILYTKHFAIRSNFTIFASLKCKDYENCKSFYNLKHLEA